MGVLVGLLVAAVGAILFVKAKGGSASMTMDGKKNMGGRQAPSTQVPADFNFADAAYKTGVGGNKSVMDAGNIYSVNPPTHSHGATVSCKPGFIYDSKKGCQVDPRPAGSQVNRCGPKTVSMPLRKPCPGSAGYVGGPPANNATQSQAQAKPIITGKGATLTPGTVTNLAPTGLSTAIAKGLVVSQPVIASPASKPPVVVPKSATPPQASPAMKANAAKSTANQAKLKSALSAAKR